VPRSNIHIRIIPIIEPAWGALPRPESSITPELPQPTRVCLVGGTGLLLLCYSRRETSRIMPIREASAKVISLLSFKRPSYLDERSDPNLVDCAPFAVLYLVACMEMPKWLADNNPVHVGQPIVVVPHPRVARSVSAVQCHSHIACPVCMWFSAA